MTSEQRFRELLNHAWNHSAFYREIYSGHGIHQEDLPHLSLEDLPVVSKSDLMVRFDEAVTDIRLRRADLETWVQHDTNPLSLYLDEYIIVHSSAGTKIYSFVPYTKKAWRYMTASAAALLLPPAVEEPMRSAFYFRAQGHFAGATNVGLASRVAHESLRLSVFDPLEEVWARLNAFQPQRLYSYASALGWLAEWTLQGKVCIAPGSVIVSGDRLSPHVRSLVKEAWNAEIYDLYAACESLYMAVQCPGASEFRIFDDLNLLEVVDSSNRTVQPGGRGRVLLTSLIHSTLPLIRFDLYDYAVLGKIGLVAETLTSLSGKSYESLPVRLVDGGEGALEVYELAQLELPGVEKIQFVRDSAGAVEILYQSQCDLDTQIGETFHRLLAQKSAQVQSVKVRRVERILNDEATFKFWNVITAGRPTLSLASLGGESGGAGFHGPDSRVGASYSFSPEELEGSIVQRFQRVAARHPDRCALTDGERQFSYHDLDRLAGQVARELLRRGFDATRPIAVLSGHQLELVPLILGVLRAGGFYVPLDSYLPQARLQAVLTETSPEYLLTISASLEHAKSLAREGMKVLCVEEEGVWRLEVSLPIIFPDSPACLLFTSGMTGTPKGVVLSHKTILRRTARYTDDFHIHPDDRISLLQSYAVNAGTRDIYGALLNGAALVFYDIRSRGLSPLANWLNQNRITVFYAVPIVFRLLLETLGDESFPNVRIVRLGGEPPELEDIAGFRQHFAPDCWLVNGYAATETDTICQYFMHHDTPIVAGRIPAGFPIPGVDVTLRDEGGERVVGALGEITVDGEMMASGYWDGINKKVAAFKGPFATGDLGYQLPDGRIFLTERRDMIVNIRGYRIHLGEIEEAVNSVRGVAEAVAIPRTTPKGEKNIVVYYVPTGETVVNTADLRRVVASVLPGPAVPSAFMVLPALPRLPGGKVNRDLILYQPVLEREGPVEQPVYHNETEAHLARIWGEVLNVAVIPPEAEFFDLGGDSITVLKMLNRMETEFGIRLSVKEFFNHSGLVELVNLIKGRCAIESKKI